MIATIIGIVSINLGFFAVMAAYYFYQRDGAGRRPKILGLLGLLFLTVIPASTAVIVAATG